MLFCCSFVLFAHNGKDGTTLMQSQLYICVTVGLNKVYFLYNNSLTT